MGGYYSFEKTPVKHIDQVSNKKKEQVNKMAPADDAVKSGIKDSRSIEVAKDDSKSGSENGSGIENNVKERNAAVADSNEPIAKLYKPGMVVSGSEGISREFNEQLAESPLINPVQQALNNMVLADMEQHIKPAMIRDITPVLDQGLSGKKGIKVKRNLPVSLAISAGPEFNSASSVVGGDPGFNAGLTLGFGISKKLDLQTGVRYSIKKYSGAGGIRYSFPNTNATWLKNNLTDLDATCDVLEIPLTASYRVADNAHRSINLNAGISSYLMLKEDYVFKYDNQYGAATQRTLQKTNANQHLLSVVDLSATYFMKLKNNNLKIGLEPFMKIPLSGVGEGNINLKSSGISLKLRYDLDKKNN